MKKYLLIPMFLIATFAFAHADCGKCSKDCEDKECCSGKSSEDKECCGSKEKK